MREIILDTETTGLETRDGHRIVEIGALEMQNKVITGKQFHFYINPERDMPSEAYRIHGISGEFLKNKPLFAEIADEFLEFIQGSKLVIHNAPFDLKFLNHELALVKKPPIDFAVAIDTLVIARKMFPSMRNNLDALCKRFKINNSGRKLHGALKDAALLADVYVELTGGRQVKFNIYTEAQKVEQNSSMSCNISQNNISPIIRPTREELERHKAFLAKITTPIWSNY